MPENIPGGRGGVPAPLAVCQRSACTKVKHKRASVPGLAVESLPLSPPGFRFPDAAYEATINRMSYKLDTEKSFYLLHGPAF